MFQFLNRPSFVRTRLNPNSNFLFLTTLNMRVVRGNNWCSQYSASLECKKGATVAFLQIVFDFLSNSTNICLALTSSKKGRKFRSFQGLCWIPIWVDMFRGQITNTLCQYITRNVYMIDGLIDRSTSYYPQQSCKFKKGSWNKGQPTDYNHNLRMLMYVSKNIFRI